MSTNRNCKPILKRTVVDITDPKYFCNKSWTLSYNVNTKSWVSFHSYIPNFYIAENNFFYSGLNSCCDDSISLDVISTKVLPPLPTTTTTSSSTSTTSSTTTIPFNCALAGTTSTLDCSLEGVAISDDITCSCYIVTNTTTSTKIFAYMQCDGTPIEDQPVLAGQSAYICARTGTVVVNGNYFNVSGPLGDCTVDGECTTSTTSSTTTLVCTSCKTIYIENTSQINITFTYYDCEPVERTLPIGPSEAGNLCICEDLTTFPAGLSHSVVQTGCASAFCYTLVNGTETDKTVSWVAPDTSTQTQTLGPDQLISFCALQGSINPNGTTLTGGTLPCTTDQDCDCWNC